MSILWNALVHGLASVWPATRTTLGGEPLGDVWPCDTLRREIVNFSEGDDLIPFHKLTGWLTYSLIEPMEKI